MREANAYQQIRDLLQAGNQTKWLKQQASNRNRLLIVISLYVSPDERDNLVSCNIYKSTLFLKVSSQSLATRLRFENRQLLKSLSVHEEFSEVKKISIGISRASSQTEVKRKKNPPLRRINPQIQELLEDTAAGIEDEELAQAMRKLALKASRSNSR